MYRAFSGPHCTNIRKFVRCFTLSFSCYAKRTERAALCAAPRFPLNFRTPPAYVSFRRRFIVGFYRTTPVSIVDLL